MRQSKLERESKIEKIERGGGELDRKRDISWERVSKRECGGREKERENYNKRMGVE